MSGKTRRHPVLDAASDLMSCFLYYDRKEDPSLTHGSIYAAIIAGEVSVEEILSVFEQSIREGVAGATP